MDTIPFYKMSGAGNDFIIIDNRWGVVAEEGLSDWIERICRRKLSVGADGLILIEEAEGVDFRWRFFNADGGRAEMCGNGARCAARFAYLRQIAGQKMSFQTDAGIISAWVDQDRVRIGMTEPTGLRIDETLELEDGPMTVSCVNTGVPHAVAEVADIEAVDVAGIGREIRYHERFAPAGTNANFVQALADGSLAMRTYERGVEDETLACGTGAVAAALVAAATRGVPSPVNMFTRSRETLTIHFNLEKGRFSEVYLEGGARVVYTGELWPDAWGY
jgi:diaminopimelate epimerase